MDFEEFKEKFVEDVKQGLYERGGEDVNVSLHTVNKLNESYDAMTITPVGSNIGVNLSIDRFYEAMDHGVSYEEAVLTAFPSKGLSVERLLETIQSYPGTFWHNKQHKDRMEMFNHRLGYMPKRNTTVYYAVMYLLTTSEELFRRTSNCFYRKGVEFDYAVLQNISLHDYALYAVAKDLYTGTVKLTLLDMADCEIVDDEAFRLIINATLIAKYGVQAFNLKKEVPKNGY